LRLPTSSSSSSSSLLRPLSYLFFRAEQPFITPFTIKRGQNGRRRP
jgi:hypothetical protein